MAILMSNNSTLARIVLKYFEWVIESLQKKCFFTLFLIQINSQYVKKKNSELMKYQDYHLP